MLLHWIWLATRPNLHEREQQILLQHFRDPEDIFYGDSKAFAGIEGLSEAGLEALQDKDLKQAHAILRDCDAQHIHICTFHDGAYPGRLKNIADPPVVLYYKGRMPQLDDCPVITVVGTRNASGYGMNTAARLGGQIARCGGTVVSGMASGIDAAAIGGALSAGGSVVGVLGNGVDVVYPKSCRALYSDTERFGCLMSEFPPGTPPLKWNFPKRNRIMSGLANGVLVVEAPNRSGALITARQAAEQGRDVFVVPGNIDVPTCAGSNALLRDGAIAVAKGWDIISEYESLYPERVRRYDRPVQAAGFVGDMEPEGNMPVKVAQEPISLAKKRRSDKKKEKITIDNAENQPYSDIHDTFPNLSDTEQKIVRELAGGEMLVDDIIAKTGLPTGTVLSTLTILEIRGIVRRMPGKRVALK